MLLIQCCQQLPRREGYAWLALLVSRKHAPRVGLLRLPTCTELSYHLLNTLTLAREVGLHFIIGLCNQLTQSVSSCKYCDNEQTNLT